MKPYRLLALAGLACMVPQLAHAQPAPVATAPVLSPETRLDHISIRTIGSGEPVVLIPGLASPRAVWDGILPALARDHRVILVQVNGFGGDAAGANAGEGLLPGAVADVAQWLEFNHVDHPAVIGHSMGGLIGMMLTRDHPGLVGRLMIVDALPFFGVVMGPGVSVDTLRPMATQMRDQVRAGPPASAPPPNMSNSEAGRARVLEWQHHSDPAAVAEALYEDLTSDFRPDVASLAGRPVTLLYAVPDAATAGMVQRLYASGYAGAPNVRLVPVEDSMHFIMLDQPERFAQQVEAFLSTP